MVCRVRPAAGQKKIAAAIELRNSFATSDKIAVTIEHAE
jgi:hypothetical protein